MARTVGVKHSYLIRDKWEVWEFIDDYRPAAESTLPSGRKIIEKAIDRRYAEYNMFSGMVWFQDRKDFETPEDGNDFYLALLNDGYKPCTENDVWQLKRKAAIMTY